MNDINDEIDEFGLPKHIAESPREVTGTEQIPHQLDINLLEHAAEIDKVRVMFRSGVEFLLEEVWHNGVITISIRTKKGQRSFATYNPNEAGYNAMRVSAPVDIL